MDPETFDKIIDVINKVITSGPTILFLFIVLWAFLVGFLRGFRKSKILFIHSLVSFALCFTLFMLFTRNEKVDGLLLSIVDSIMGGPKSLQNYFGIDSSLELVTLKDVLVQGLPNIMDFGDYSTLITENGAYLRTLVDMIYNIVFAIVLWVLYLILILLLRLMYALFYSDRKYKRKLNKAFINKKSDCTFKKRRLLGGVIGAFRGVISGIIILSFIGSSLYLIAGNGQNDVEEITFENDEYNKLYGVYRSVETYGSSGIYQVLNVFKDSNDQPYYLFAADLLFSGKLEVSDLAIDENIKFREEIGAYTQFATDIVNLLVKYGNEDIVNIVNGTQTADMNVIINVMQQENFQKEFEVLIEEFDSKSYFINLTFALATSLINNIDDFISDIPTKELIKVFFKKGYYSDYIPDEYNATQMHARKKANGSNEELEALPYIHISNLIKKEDVLTIYKLAVDLLNYSTEASGDATQQSLDMAKKIIPYIGELSIVSDKRKDELDPVFTRVYSLIENIYLTGQELNEFPRTGITTKEITDENVSWVKELRSLIGASENILQLVENVYSFNSEEVDPIEVITSIFEDDINRKLYNNVSKAIEDSALLGKVMASNYITEAIEETLSESFSSFCFENDVVFENQYDKNGNLVKYGELHQILSGIAILVDSKDEEGNSILDSLINSSEEDSMDTILKLSKILSAKDDNNATLKDYLVNSSLLYSTVSALLIDFANQKDSMIIIPDESVKIINKTDKDGNKVEIKMIKKDEYTEIVSALDDVMEIINQILNPSEEAPGEEEELDEMLKIVKDLVNNDSIMSLLNNNKIIEATCSNLILTALEGVEQIVIPAKLKDAKNWVKEKELDNIINCLKNEDLLSLFSNLENLSDSIKKIQDLGEEKYNKLIDDLFSSKVLYYTVSNVIDTLDLGTGEFKVIVPTLAKNQLKDDTLPYLIKIKEIRTLLNEIPSFIPSDSEGSSSGDGFSNIFVHIINSVVYNEPNEESLFEKSSILSASLAYFLSNSSDITSLIKIPVSLIDEAELESIKEFDSDYKWYKELPSLVYALEEIFDTKSEGEGFEFTEDVLTDKVAPLVNGLRNESTIKSGKSRLDVCFDSMILKATLSDKLIEAVDGTLDVPGSAKDSEGVLKKEEIEFLSMTLELLEIEDINNMDTGAMGDKISDLTSNLNEVANISNNNDNLTNLKVLYGSRIIAKLLTTEVNDLLSSQLDAKLLEEIQDSEGIYKEKEIQGLVNTFEVLGIDMNNIDGFNLDIASFNDEAVGFDGKTKLQIIYDSKIVTSLMSNLMDDALTDSLIDENVRDHSNIKENGIYKYDEMNRIVIAAKELDIEDLDSFDSDTITLAKLKDEYTFNKIYASYIVEGIISKALSNISGLKIHEKAYVSNDFKVFKQSEISTILSFVSGENIGLADVSFNSNIDDITSKIYNPETGKTESYLLVANISHTLENGAASNIIVPSEIKENKYIKPIEIYNLFNVMKALGMDDVSTGGTELSNSLPTNPDVQDAIAKSTIARATFTSFVSDTASNNDKAIFARDNIDIMHVGDTSEKAYVIKETQLKNLFNALSGGFEIPSFDLNAIIAMDESDLVKYLNVDPIRYIIVDEINKKINTLNVILEAIGSPTIGLLSDMQAAINISTNGEITKVTATLEEIKNKIAEIQPLL